MKIYPQVINWLIDSMISITNKKFLESIDRTSACWNWKLCVNTGGYGSFRRVTGETTQAHVYSYALHNNKISKFGKPVVTNLVLHKCGNRKCCNPEHLYEGNYKDNARDAFVHGTSTYKFITASIDEIKALQAQGLTQVEIAKLLKVTQSGLSRFISRNTKETFCV